MGVVLSHNDAAARQDVARLGAREASSRCRTAAAELGVSGAAGRMCMPTQPWRC